MGEAAASLAAPVLTSEDQVPASGSLVTPSQLRPAIGAGGVPSSTAPDASTGNKNLDLLLELQGKGGEQGAMTAKGAASAVPTPASAAAAATAAKALAALRAKAAQQPAAEDTPPKPVLPFVGGQGLLGDEARRTQPAERREWSGQVSGGGDHRDGPHEASGSSHADHTLLKLPMEVIAYLRENRFWVLGGVGVLLLLGAALKAYSRRI